MLGLSVMVLVDEYGCESTQSSSVTRTMFVRFFSPSLCNSGKAASVFLRLLDRIQNVRLAVLITVRADTKVNLAGVLVGLESLGDT